MSLTSTRPPPASPTPPSRGRWPAAFGPALRAEWVKFRTVRGWLIGLVLGWLAMRRVHASSSPTATTRASAPVLEFAPAATHRTDRTRR